MKTAFLALLTLLLAGCTAMGGSFGLKGAGLASDALYADDIIQSGRVERSILSVEMSEGDIEAVIEAFDTYTRSREALKEVVRDPVRALDVEHVLRIEHARLAEAYQVLEAVVKSNWGAYSDMDQARLQRWQEQAGRLEANYQNFMVAARMAKSENAKAAQYQAAARAIVQIAVMAL